MGYATSTNTTVLSVPKTETHNSVLHEVFSLCSRIGLHELLTPFSFYIMIFFQQHLYHNDIQYNLMNMYSPFRPRLSFPDNVEEECNINKSCPTDQFCDVHVCRSCLHENSPCHFIGKTDLLHGFLMCLIVLVLTHPVLQISRYLLYKTLQGFNF